MIAKFTDKHRQAGNLWYNLNAMWGWARVGQGQINVMFLMFSAVILKNSTELKETEQILLPQRHHLMTSE